MQNFIFYGKQILSVSPEAVKTILEMAHIGYSSKKYKEKPIDECDNCQGVLVAQSLVLTCGDIFTLDQWVPLIKSIISQIEKPIKNDFLKAKYHCSKLVLQPHWP